MLAPTAEPRQPSRPLAKRLITFLLAAAVLVAVFAWLMDGGVDAVDLGAGEHIVAHPESSRVAIDDGSGRWRVLHAAGDVEPGSPLALLGAPALAADGTLVGLLAPRKLDGSEQLVIRAPGQPEELVALPRGGGGLPGASGYRLLGLTGPDEQPVIHQRSERSLWRLVDGQWREVVDVGNVAATPAADTPFALCAARAVVAFRGDQGWEAWVLDGEAAVRRVAKGCQGDVAAFSPDGSHLITDGPLTHIYRLDLADGRLTHCADGNLGSHRRLPWSSGVRGDPPMLVAPQLDLHGWLQVVQTHFSGGGRYQFNTGYEHHYLPTVSPEGRWLTYAQTASDLDDDSPFEEDLYLFDFDNGTSPARDLGRRSGGVPLRGPVWARLPDGLALLWVAEGRVRRLDLTE